MMNITVVALLYFFEMLVNYCTIIDMDAAERLHFSRLRYL